MSNEQTLNKHWAMCLCFVWSIIELKSAKQNKISVVVVQISKGDAHNLR